MTHEPQKDNLDDILRALRDEPAAVREQAVHRLYAYANFVANSLISQTENDTSAEEEALEAWDKVRRQTLQQSRIVEALLIAIDDPSAKVRGFTALLLQEATIPEAQVLTTQAVLDQARRMLNP